METVDFPSWLHALAVASLALGGACALFLVVDLMRRPQKMWIMNLVWPLTALFGSLLWLAGYLAWGRAPRRGREADRQEKPPFPAMVAKGASHCGAGCTLGDIVAEWLAFLVPAVAVFLGWQGLFEEKTFAVWILDFLLAFLIGLVFQYYTIKPMRGLSVGQGIWQALKADSASIAAWQVGMYGFMAVAQFAWYAPAYGATAKVNQPEFWFAMQIAMLFGFATSYPVNWLLLRAGVKEKM